ncbi:MAG: aminopeptidase [Anaerolineales bacterium]
MDSEFERNLNRYAEVIVRVGLNLQPGQRLLIYQAPIELAPFVRLIATKAYQAGARLVDVIWNDDQLQLLRFQHAPNNSFSEYPEWKANASYEIARSSDSRLRFNAENPDLLVGQDPELLSIASLSTAKHSQPYANLQDKNALNWTVVAAPVAGWTEKVFPALSPDSRTAKLWDTLFDICRVKQEDPALAWQEHIDQLIARCNYLNHKRYTSLKLNAPGTDLIVGLPKKHIWQSGRMTTRNGIEFIANIPTEEIFTLPHKDKTEGIVTATKPLSYHGVLIENFTLTFSKGRVVKASATKGEEVLRKLLMTDKGASLLGEVALVPHKSPISQTGLLYYNILIDENAANHLALGEASRFFMKGGEIKPDDEFEADGGNLSLIHVDFMIGSVEMDVDGLTENGLTEPVMRKGEWAFDL